jgi:para-aminobenzoate synthetase component 1
MIFSSFNWNKTSILELKAPRKAFIYYRKTRLDLLTGFPQTYPVERFLSELESLKLQDKVDKPLVFHFHYELGLLLAGLGHHITDETPLAIEIEYEKKKWSKKRPSSLRRIPLKTLERPTWSEYKEAFAFIQEELLQGNCYQVNLTYPFEFETEEVFDPHDICDFFFSRHPSAFAHATYLGDEMILSNSPECLFQYEKNSLLTMPIKGTVKRQKNWKPQWEKMLGDLKEEGELNMITDLLRNDLNKIEHPRAKVIRKRSPLLVPGLLHQYSLLSVELESSVSMLKSLEALFPGGSVTGAPKKRVMDIIQRAERYPRGIYCGSTVLCLDARKVASINIRTASLSLGDRLWKYGAGGGITLLSRPTSEFQEMEQKVASFLTLLKAPGY